MPAHITVLDASTVVLNNGTASVSVTGPLTAYAESVTVGGSDWLGTVIVSGGTAFQSSRLTPGQSDLLAPVLTLSFLLAFVAVKLRL